MMTSLADRLARSAVAEPDGCVLWTGAVCTKGYGQFALNGTRWLAHRAAYVAAYGEIPDGLVIDHLCHDPRVCTDGRCQHRLCINPAHLAAVTNEDNLKRQWPAFKTHCVRGHDYAVHGRRLSTNGKRYCAACHAAHWSALKERRQRLNAAA